MHNAHCTLYTTQCTKHNVECTMHTTYYTMHTAHCTLHNAQCTMHNAQCTMHTDWWPLGGQVHERLDVCQATLALQGLHFSGEHCKRALALDMWIRICSQLHILNSGATQVCITQRKHKRQCQFQSNNQSMFDFYLVNCPTQPTCLAHLDLCIC